MNGFPLELCSLLLLSWIQKLNTSKNYFLLFQPISTLIHPTFDAFWSNIIARQGIIKLTKILIMHFQNIYVTDPIKYAINLPISWCLIIMRFYPNLPNHIPGSDPINFVYLRRWLPKHQIVYLFLDQIITFHFGPSKMKNR